MRIELRKRHPYFGKYKIKISIFNRSWRTNFSNAAETQQTKVKEYLQKCRNSPKEYKWVDAWNVYLKNEEVFDDVNKAFPDHVGTMYKPAPGYEDLEGVADTEERVLWYEKYPYKVTLLNVSRNNSFEYSKWCVDNIDGDIRTSTGAIEASFYFMNSLDATAFKLAFGDTKTKTYVANKEKAAILLKERMEKSIREYHEYLEGEKDDSQKK